MDLTRVVSNGKRLNILSGLRRRGAAAGSPYTFMNEPSYVSSAIKL